MTAEVLSCPYCNAALPWTDATAQAPRIRCPRCQEVFTNRLSAVGPLPSAVGQAEPGSVDSPGRWPIADGRWPSNRTVAAMVLGLMAFMALAGLVLALATQEQRRERDFPPAASDPAVLQSGSPAPVKLQALGYLPQGTNVVMGLQIAACLRDPVGRELLPELQWGTLGINVKSLETWTGLRLEEIDHAVLGIRLDDRLPRLTLVVQTNRPVVEKALREKLRANRRADNGNRVMYRFSLERPPLEPVVWFAGAQTVIFALSAQDLNDVPLEPKPGLDNLPAPVQEAMKTRLPSGTSLWLTGHVGDWHKTVMELPLQGLPKEQSALFASVRTLAIWAGLGPDPQANASLECADEASAQTLDGYLQLAAESKRDAAADGAKRMLTNTLLGDLAQSLTHTRRGNWVHLQSRLRTVTMREAIKPPAGERTGKP